MSTYYGRRFLKEIHYSKGGWNVGLFVQSTSLKCLTNPCRVHLDQRILITVTKRLSRDDDTSFVTLFEIRRRPVFDNRTWKTKRARWLIRWLETPSRKLTRASDFDYPISIEVIAQLYVRRLWNLIPTLIVGSDAFSHPRWYFRMQIRFTKLSCSARNTLFTFQDLMDVDH